MNELEFLEVLNDIEDDLILNAKKPVPKKSPVPALLAKVAVVAAILCMLSLSVMAVSFSIRVLRSEDRVPIHEFFLGGIFAPTSKVTTVDYDLQPQRIRLPSQWIDTLTEGWETFGYDYRYFRTQDLKSPTGSRMDFGGVSQLEELLGVELVSSPELDEAVRGAYVTMVITDSHRAIEEYERKKQITPDGLVIYLPFRTGKTEGLSAETVRYCGIHIYLPITESFADSYQSHVVLSGVGDQDLQKRDYRSRGNIDTVLLTNTPSAAEDPLKTFAAWEYRGVGYLLELKTHHSTCTDPVQLILPYLEHLED
ncbi:MAG: hypothetical protein IKM59_00995 [Oscillospiraceae bacterium]|nr:hypothetical protein [Oscillospiraceae bacterium]